MSHTRTRCRGLACLLGAIFQVSAAMAAMIALFEPSGFGLTHIMLICVPATLIGVVIAALVQTRVGKELKDDPEYNRRLKAGEVTPPKGRQDKTVEKELPWTARTSALMFLCGVALVVAAGLFPALRPEVPKGNATAPLDMATTIQIVMLSVAALTLLGVFTVHPNQGRVMQLFGSYRGTAREPGPGPPAGERGRRPSPVDRTPPRAPVDGSAGRGRGARRPDPGGPAARRLKVSGAAGPSPSPTGVRTRSGAPAGPP